MPYDPGLDECLFTKTWENDSGRITVSIFSYNQGAKKLQISRENRSGPNEFRYAKLGRLAKEEAEAILPLVQEALQKMD